MCPLSLPMPSRRPARGAVGATGEPGATGPIGAIVMWPTATPPTGWILCNGQATTDYPLLAAIVGPTVPDMQGRFPLGAGPTPPSGTVRALGASSGADTIPVTGLPAHGHDLALQYSANTNTTSGSAIRVVNIEGTTGGSGTAATATTKNTGGAQTHLPPWYGVHFIIRAH